jgi:integrase
LINSDSPQVPERAKAAIISALACNKESELNRRKKSGGRTVPWNKGKLLGQKLALSLKEVRAIRHRLRSAQRMRDFVLFSLAIDSNLRACDLVELRVRDVSKGRHIASHVTIGQSQNRPVQFEISDETRDSIAAWIAKEGLKPDDYLFPSRLSASPHLSIRQYARDVASWVSLIGLDPGAYGTQSLRRTKPALMYRRTRDLEAVQQLLGHTKPENTARFLGIHEPA